MKFVLFVEGHTENKAIPGFLKRWLDPRLERPVGIKTVLFDGWPELIKDLSVKVPMYLHGPGRRSVIAVIALLDLYGPTFYPDPLSSAEERRAWAIREYENKMGDRRFRMFFAVHEVEAWLLSQPGIFPKEICKAVEDRVRKPESVNIKEPPARFLDLLYQSKLKRPYRKIGDGVLLFKKLDPEVVVRTCPSFKSMMTTLLELARTS